MGIEQVVGISAFLHDIHRLMQNETGKFIHPKDSLVKVNEVLEMVMFPKEKIPKVIPQVKH